MRDDAVRRSTRRRAGDAESSEAVAGQLSWMRTFPQGRRRIGSSDHFEMVAWCSGVLSTRLMCGMAAACAKEMNYMLYLYGHRQGFWSKTHGCVV